MLADKIADFLSDNIVPERRIILEYLSDNEEEILNNAVSGRYSEYSTVIIDGTVEKDADGREKASVIHTKKDDGRIMTFQEMLSRPELSFVIWKERRKTQNLWWYGSSASNQQKVMQFFLAHQNTRWLIFLYCLDR